MSDSLTIAVGQFFTIISPTVIEAYGTRYNDVSTITFSDGSVKTCADLLAAAGGSSYSDSELRRCVKVELYDPDSNNRQVATIYSTNSHQVGKNSTQGIPGGAWVEMFDFKGTKDSNYILKMWYDRVGSGYLSTLSQNWIGFKFNYGVSAAHSYVLTYVNEFKEESLPCPPSDIGVTHMHYAQLYGKFKPPTTITAGGITHSYAQITALNLYRSNVASTQQALYQQVPVVPSSYTPSVIGGVFPLLATNPNYQYGYLILDNVEADALGTVLSTVDFNPPAPRQLLGLTPWKNGMMAAFWKNTLKFCEPYRPSAWPLVYQVPLPHKILALAVDDNILVVITEGPPYIFMGPHPSALTHEVLQTPQGGIAPPAVNGWVDRARSVVKTSSGVIYLSREGPINIVGGRATPIGRELFTREKWVQSFPRLDGYRLSFADGKLIIWPWRSTERGAQIDLDGDPQFTYWDLGRTLWGAQVLPHDDSLYFLTSASASPPADLRRWNDENATYQDCTYTTRAELCATPVNMGVLQVIGYGGSVYITVFADGVARDVILFDLSLGSDVLPIVVQRRLKAGFKARRYWLEIYVYGNTVVKEVLLATTPMELAGA